MTTHTRPIHLNGSLSLHSAKDVFTKVAEIGGPCVHSIPDGETGERSAWVGWQLKSFVRNPQLELEETTAAHPDNSREYSPQRKYVIREGVSAADLRFADLGYAEAAIGSYKTFAELKKAGIIARETRFQVALPTPVAILTPFVAEASQEAVEPALEEAVLRDLRRILAAIPHDQLLIQWDVAVEFGILETDHEIFASHLRGRKDDILDRLAKLGDAVPTSVKLGYHLCYGDLDQKHFKEPADAGLLVEISNGIFRRVSRPVDLIHMPVPIDRDDAAYFAPLEKLERPEGTLVFLGLVHLSDGVEGARRRIGAASRYIRDFGVASECGLGRRSPEWMDDMLALHREVAEQA